MPAYMWIQFFLENAHFAANLFIALVFFAVFWLYFDAWAQRRDPKGVIKLAGYLLLSLSFVVHAVSLESTVLAASILGGSLLRWVLAILRIPGYLLVLLSLFLDRLEPVPEYKKAESVPAVLMLPAASASLVAWPYVFYPILAVTVAVLYLRRATIGLEDHLKPVAWSFFFLTVAEFLSMARLFEETDSVFVYQVVAPFGWLWIVEHVMYLVSAIILGKWIFGYLLKQFETQLFMIFTVSTLIIFLVTTVSFTGLLLKNIQDGTLKQLDTDVKVLNFAIEGKKEGLLSDVAVVAQNPTVVAAVLENARKPLADFAGEFLLAKNESMLVITSETGQVLARGEDRDRAGESLSDDPIVKRALLGESAASVVTRDGVLAPEISIRAATPIKDQGKIIGVVLAGSLIDNAFVDGLKTATGLETSIYGDNQVSASTIVSTDGKSRLAGIKEEHASIKTKVLTDGESYTGDVTLLQIPYFAAYLPLKNVDANPVGMLFVGQPQYSVLQTAGRSIELTFLVTAFLLVICVFPAYFIAKYLADQI
jgi:hypothetical protein